MVGESVSTIVTVVGVPVVPIGVSVVDSDGDGVSSPPLVGDAVSAAVGTTDVVVDDEGAFVVSIVVTSAVGSFSFVVCMAVGSVVGSFVGSNDGNSVGINDGLYVFVGEGVLSPVHSPKRHRDIPSIDITHNATHRFSKVMSSQHTGSYSSVQMHSSTGDGLGFAVVWITSVGSGVTPAVFVVGVPVVGVPEVAITGVGVSSSPLVGELEGDNVVAMEGFGVSTAPGDSVSSTVVGDEVTEMDGASVDPSVGDGVCGPEVTVVGASVVTFDGSGVSSSPFVGDNVVEMEGLGVPAVIGEGVSSDVVGDGLTEADGAFVVPSVGDGVCDSTGDVVVGAEVVETDGAGLSSSPFVGDNVVSSTIVGDTEVDGGCVVLTVGNGVFGSAVVVVGAAVVTNDGAGVSSSLLVGDNVVAVVGSTVFVLTGEVVSSDDVGDAVCGFADGSSVVITGVGVRCGASVVG